MVFAQQVDYNLDEMKVKYDYVTVLYDLSDELLATVESPFVKDREAQMNLVEPVIREISDATDVLSEEFIHVAEGRSGVGAKPNKLRVENALRKIFTALDDYRARVNVGSKKLVGGIKNIADPIIRKIQRHVEEVVVIFFEFMSLSLASIMHKQQLEAIRVRDPRVALMMHQHAMSQQ